MQGLTLNLPVIDPAYSVSLINERHGIVYGAKLEGFAVEKNAYFEYGSSTVLVSDATQGHLDISYVVVQSNRLSEMLHTLKTTVISMMVLAATVIVVIAWILSKLFMRPVRQKIDQVETFIKDVTHELNTPITALRMATERAMEKETYDKKAFRNISISTKQLYDIYASLTYLNFSHKEEKAAPIDLNTLLLKSIDYYKELCESKRIVLHVESESLLFPIAPDRATMLFGNLISNAIKYSMANSEVVVSLKNGIFTIEDHGIGIDPERVSKIFERYNRETEYAGGFGVGLNIVQSICTDHHIKIDVRSEKGKGTIFGLTFPGSVRT
jgi:two-component system OmpR family sensor kinase